MKRLNKTRYFQQRVIVSLLFAIVVCNVLGFACPMAGALALASHLPDSPFHESHRPTSGGCPEQLVNHSETPSKAFDSISCSTLELLQFPDPAIHFVPGQYRDVFPSLSSSLPARYLLFHVLLN